MPGRGRSFFSKVWSAPGRGLKVAARLLRRLAPKWRWFQILARVWRTTYEDGMIHAGNMAYLALLAIFPFFITVTAILSALGEPAQRDASIDAFLLSLPKVVAQALGPVAHDVVAARSGALLWIGGAVGLWTATGLLETIRDILHRAYDAPHTVPFWRNRLLSLALIFGAVFLLMLSLYAQVAVVAAEQAFSAWAPGLQQAFERLSLTRLITAIVIYGSIWMLFVALTPPAFVGRKHPKWPGALLITAWWVSITVLLPWALRFLFTYDLTYGSLAGVMIALFFFWLVGLGIVVGAELNAALTLCPQKTPKGVPEE